MHHVRAYIAFTLLLIFGSLLPQRSLAQEQSFRSPVADTRTMGADYAHAPSIEHLWHWTRFPVHLFIATHDATEDQAARRVLAGFDQWVTATQGGVHYTIVDNPRQAEIIVRFVNSAFLPGEPDVAGETRVSTTRGFLKKAAMLIATGRATSEELQSVAAHEFGHALGIGGHSDQPGDLMSPVTIRYVSQDGTPFVTPVRQITPRDLNTLRLCYSDRRY